jgi:thiol-disulfide isomerase/thioredoxin
MLAMSPSSFVVRHLLSAALLTGALAGCSKPSSAPAPVTAEPAPAAAPAAPAAAEPDPGEEQAIGAREVLLGTRAAAASVKLVDGKTLNLADLLGKKPIYLKFWATWCEPCREQMPHFEATQQQIGDRIALVAVDLGLNDSLEAVQTFRATHPMSMPVAFDDDGRLAEAFHVTVTPQHILIDRSGVIRYIGHATNPELEKAIEALLGDAPTAAPIAEAQAPAAADAPPPVLAIVDGDRASLSQYAGAPFAVTFVSTWCSSYLAESRPEMSKACIAHDRLAQSLRAKHPKLPWLIVASPVWTDVSGVRDYKKEFEISAPIAIDLASAWFHHFHVRDVQTTILFDAKGKEVARISGDGAALEPALIKLAKK